MFAIKRFDGRDDKGSAGEPSNGATQRVDRIALLNQRKQQEQAQQQAQSSPTDVSAKIATPASGLPIHPSRLAVSQALRQSDKKARSSANGTAKEKTRAKQRYLNRKKDRRKKRKVAAVASAPKRKETAAGALGAVETHAYQTESDGDSSDDDDDSDKSSSVEQAPQEPTQPSLPTPTLLPTPDDPAKESEDVVMEEAKGDASGEVTDSAPLLTEAPPAALTRFPAVRATTQATKRDLAVQGLPEGLAKPKVVDAAQTAIVSQTAQSEGLDLISDTTRARLNALGITHWFAVQTAIIPKLLAHPTAYDLYPSPAPGDVCVSAPTGSGKTLSYVVPIVEVLRRRICRRVRALILLPTRELVHQVRETIEAVCKNTGLTIASLTGQQSFAHEQGVLVDADPLVLRGGNVAGLIRSSTSEEEVLKAASTDRPIESKVDIVIATPGRLIDHMDRTPGFTLQHLRFLVIDEADRLLSQSFQEWLPRVLSAIDPPAVSSKATQQQPKSVVANKKDIDQMTALSPAWLYAQRMRDSTLMTTRLPRPTSGCQKLLFSATLTRDPAKIVALNLRGAAFFSVEDAKKEGDNDDGDDTANGDWQDAFALPSTLREHMLVSSTADKPLHLLHLLYTHAAPLRQALCFTKSVQSANRLVKLLEFVDDARRARHARALLPPPATLVVGEFSSELRGVQRVALLDDFRAGRVDILVCSDVIARGIDLPMVANVVSYDAPIDMAKYVHRVGRTARAGRVGDAWTLVEEQEARHFTAMIRRAKRWSSMNKIRIPKPLRDVLKHDDDEDDGKVTADSRPYFDLVQDYQAALQGLAAHFSRTHAGK